AARAARLPRHGLEAAAERVRRLRDQRSARSQGGTPVRDLDGPPLAMAIASRAVTPVSAGPADFRRALNGGVSVVFPRFSELAPRITVEPEVADERPYLVGAFASVGIVPSVLLVGIEPTAAEIAAAAERAATADATVLFLYDAHLLASNRALLAAVQARARALGEAFPDEALERVFVHAHDTDLPPGTFRTGRGPGRTAFSWGVSTRSKRSANVRRTTATTASTTAGRSNGTAILTRHVLPGLRVTQGATTAPTSRWIASVSSI